MAIQALGESDLVIPEGSPLELEVFDWIITPGERIDPDTGEVDNFPRLCLFNAKGETFVTTSCVVPHRLKAMLEIYPRDRWQKGIKVLVFAKRARKTGRTYHDLRVIPELDKEM